MGTGVTVLTSDQGDDLAARITAAIDQRDYRPWTRDPIDADRKCVTSDLAALHRAHEGLAEHVPTTSRLICLLDGRRYPCPDVHRYTESAQAASEGLTGLAQQYGVTPLTWSAGA